MNDTKKYAGMDYESVLRKFADTITRICIVNIGNSEDAKDCFQNVFLKLYLCNKYFLDENHIKAWLIRVAINECKDFHKSIWKKRVQLGFGGISEERIPRISPLSYDEDCSQVISILQSLPQKYRHILYLYYCESFNTKEIAESLNLSVNTVKSRLLRGRNKLKERWNIYD